MRKLASVQIVTAIEPIEGADRIELAKVLGWQCVVNKDTLKVGDKAVYFEIDSFLPIEDKFEFLRKSSYKKSDLLGEGFRLRTQKFKGALSQGLLLPVSNFDLNPNIKVGADVTDILGVRKWEIAERATSGGTVAGTLPQSVPHTDETRIQANPDLLKEFAGLDYYISTKMDGSSHSISIDENGFHVSGHNYEYKDDGKCSFYEFIKKRNIDENLKHYSRHINTKNLVIQGEYCGDGIQKNRLKLTTPEWYVFTIIKDGKRLGLNEMKTICEDLNLTMVPIEETGNDLPSKYPTIEDLLARSDGEYPNGGKKEGIVIRPITPVRNKLLDDEWLSMKVVNNKYLLKHND